MNTMQSLLFLSTLLLSAIVFVVHAEEEQSEGGFRIPILSGLLEWYMALPLPWQLIIGFGSFFSFMGLTGLDGGDRKTHGGIGDITGDFVRHQQQIAREKEQAKESKKAS